MSLPELFSEEWWALEEEEFYTKWTDVRHPVRETREEAISRKAGGASDEDGYHPETGDMLLQIPYLNGVRHDHLDYMLKVIQSEGPRLEDMFERREGSAEFLNSRVRFNEAYGFISAIVMYQGDDLGHERAGAAGDLSAYRRKRWVSHLLMREIDAGRVRKQAEWDVAQAIKALLKSTECNEEVRGWGSDLLHPDGKGLATPYTQKRLSVRRMRRLIEHGNADLPATEILISHT